MKQQPSIEEIAAQYKYTLWRRWQDLTKAEQTRAKLVLPNALGMGFRSFEKWFYYRKDDYKSIPADCLYKLATFFGCTVEQMWTEAPKSLHLERIKISNPSYQLTESK